MASCTATWTSATSSMPCGPGRAIVTASIVMAFQSVTASAWATVEKPRAAHTTTPASFGSLNMSVLLLWWWLLAARVGDDDRACIDVSDCTGGRAFGADLLLGLDSHRDQAIVLH